MKKLFIALLALLLCLSMILPILNIQASAAEEEEDTNVWDTLLPAYMSTSYKSIEDRILGNDVIAGMQLMLIKDGYALYCDPMTGEVVNLVLEDPIKDEKGNYVLDENGNYTYELIEGSTVYKYKGYWSTNPYNIGSSQSSAGLKTSDSIKQKLYSQAIIEYTENDTDMSFNTFVDSALNDQITVKNIRSGIRVEYTIGREEVKYLVPRLIRKEKLEALEEQIKERSDISKDARTFKSFYILKDPNQEGISIKTIEEMKVKYPICERFPIYVCEPKITAQELLRVEKLVKKYTDYTFEQMDADHAETEYTATDKTPALFKMAIEYTIDEYGVQVRVNAGNIRFDSSNYKLSNVTLLPYAGAGNTNNSGYIFSPDGSGTIITFDKILGTAFKTQNQMYGPDYAFHTITGANKQTFRLPCFGVVEIVEDAIKKKDYVQLVDEEGNLLFDEEGNPVMSSEMQTFYEDLKIGYLAVITEGDSLANITIENGGSVHMFASAYTSFNPRPKDTYELDGGLSAGSNAMWTVESKRKYTKDFKIRYFILTDDISYSGMANTYRDYLVREGVLTEMEEEEIAEDIPLYIETLGALEVTKKFLGVPIQTVIDLTSFEDTKAMLQKLKDEAGITNIKVKMDGWCNGGLPWASVPNGVKIEKALGGEKGFKELLEWCNENGMQLFPEFEFIKAASDYLFDGFNPDKDLAKTIDDRNATIQRYYASTQAYERTGHGLISARVLERFYTNTWRDYQKLGVGAISVSSLGEILGSDFNEDDPLNREDSKNLITKLLAKIEQDNGKVMISGGNYYAIKYASDIINVPLDDSRLSYSAASVPFMGSVLHGSVEFAGEAINLAGDYQYTLLKTIENGASPYFVIAINNTSELKNYNDTELGDYYSVRYSIWVADMVKTYNQLNAALKDVRTAKIVGHEFVDSDRQVCVVTYSNGVKFVINYTLEAQTVTVGDKTITVAAEDFVKIDANGNVVKLGEGE